MLPLPPSAWLRRFVGAVAYPYLRWNMGSQCAMGLLACVVLNFLLFTALVYGVDALKPGATASRFPDKVALLYGGPFGLRASAQGILYYGAAFLGIVLAAFHFAFALARRSLQWFSVPEAHTGQVFLPLAVLPRRFVTLKVEPVLVLVLVPLCLALLDWVSALAFLLTAGAVAEFNRMDYNRTPEGHFDPVPAPGIRPHGTLPSPSPAPAAPAARTFPVATLGAPLAPPSSAGLAEIAARVDPDLAARLPAM